MNPVITEVQIKHCYDSVSNSSGMIAIFIAESDYCRITCQPDCFLSNFTDYLGAEIKEISQEVRQIKTYRGKSSIEVFRDNTTYCSLKFAYLPSIPLSSLTVEPFLSFKGYDLTANEDSNSSCFILSLFNSKTKKTLYVAAYDLPYETIYKVIKTPFGDSVFYSPDSQNVAFGEVQFKVEVLDELVDE